MIRTMAAWLVLAEMANSMLCNRTKGRYLSQELRESPSVWGYFPSARYTLNQSSSTPSTPYKRSLAMRISWSTVSKAFFHSIKMAPEKCPLSKFRYQSLVPFIKHRDGSTDERSNYRPISVLPVVSRLFEKIIYDQASSYFTKSKFFCPDCSFWKASV